MKSKGIKITEQELDVLIRQHRKNLTKQEKSCSFDDVMAKTIYKDEDFQILDTHDDYVLKNLQGKHENHGHFKKADTCHLMIKLIRRMEVPKK